MGVDRGTVSSEKRAARPSRKESPSPVVSPAVEEAPVTQDIHRCNLLGCSRPTDAICWVAASQEGQLAGRRHALDGAAQRGGVPRPREGGGGWWVDVLAGKHTWVRAAERREAHGRP